MPKPKLEQVKLRITVCEKDGVMIRCNHSEFDKIKLSSSTHNWKAVALKLKEKLKNEKWTNFDLIVD